MKKKNRNNIIVLTGGGTAGHCMPNVYLLDDLKKLFDKVIYIGSDKIEKEIMKKELIEYHTIPTCKLDRSKKLKNLIMPFQLINSVHHAKIILKNINPKIVFSKGGFVSLPVCIAAHQLGIPVISHESDLSLGLANKIIYRCCDIMCTNFDMTPKKDKMITTGAILPAQLKINKNQANTDNLTIYKNFPTLLIFGGSQGALAINNFVSENRKKIQENYNIIHIVGKSNITTSSTNYNALPYSYDMASMYALADIVVGRAGAGSIFESLYCEKPMILIPLASKATRGDQLENAEYFAKRKVVEILPQNELTFENFEKKLNHIITEKTDILDRIKRLDIFDGKEKVISIIKKYI